MFPDFQIIAQMPFLYHAGLFIIVMFSIDAWRNRTAAWALPAFVLYITISAWYFLDYNLNFEKYSLQFETETRQFAMLQVIGFLISFRLFLPKIEEIIVGRAAVIGAGHRYSFVSADLLLHAMIGTWALLFTYGMLNFRGSVFEALFPVGARTDWKFLFSRGAIGSGSSFLISTAGYTYKIVCAFFGVLLWLPKQRKRNQQLNIAMVLLTFPNFFLQGTRHSMVEVFAPMLLTFLLVHRWGFKRKFIVAASLVILLDFLLTLMIVYRNTGFEGILSGTEEVLLTKSETGSKHEGLNMFEELCYINTFQQEGSYPIQYGSQYFAEVAQVIPRTFWPNKPTIGLDYAIARGFHSRHTAHGVSATISLGLIGQGIANFGVSAGFIVAGLLAAIWCGFQARLRYQSDSLLRLCLYIATIGFTVNLGRGFSLLVLWPVIFGLILIILMEQSFTLRKVGPEPAGMLRVNTA